MTLDRLVLQPDGLEHRVVKCLCICDSNCAELVSTAAASHEGWSAAVSVLLPDPGVAGMINAKPSRSTTPACSNSMSFRRCPISQLTPHSMKRQGAVGPKRLEGLPPRHQREQRLRRQPAAQAPRSVGFSMWGSAHGPWQTSAELWSTGLRAGSAQAAAVRCGRAQGRGAVVGPQTRRGERRAYFLQRGLVQRRAARRE